MSTSRDSCCLPSVKKQKHDFQVFAFVQCIIKQLLDSVFVISRIIKVSVRVISLSLRLRLITLTSTLIILDITKTASNNCLLLSGQRCQTVHALTISGMRITSDTVHFEIARLLKTSKSARYTWSLNRTQSTNANVL